MIWHGVWNIIKKLWWKNFKISSSNEWDRRTQGSNLIINKQLWNCQYRYNDWPNKIENWKVNNPMKLFYQKKKFRRHRYKCSKVGPKDGHHDVHSTWAAIFNGLRHKKFKGHSLTQLKIVTRRHDIQHLHIFHLCGSLKYYLRKLNLLAASSFNTQEASWTQIILENFYNPKRFQHIQAMLVGFDCTLEMLHPILNKLPMHVLTRLRIFWSLNWVAPLLLVLLRQLVDFVEQPVADFLPD